jgi:hypothetical protein
LATSNKARKMIRELTDSNIPKFDGWEELEVYEYQRCDLSSQWIPLDDGTFRNETSKIIYSERSLEEMRCPEHYEWMSKWKLHKSHTDVDRDGWSYGQTIAEIIERKERHESKNKPTPECRYRRRKWYRIIKASEDSLPT